MSIRLMAHVFDLTELSCPEKCLLLTLTDCATDDGEHIYPSVDTLVMKTGLSRRWVQKLLRAFEGTKLLQLVAPATRHFPARYRLDLDVLDTLPRRGKRGVPGAPLAPVRGVPSTPDSSGDSKASVKTSKTTPTPCPRAEDAASWSSATWPSPEALADAYNTLTPDNVPAVQSMSHGRRIKAEKMLRQFPARRWWEETFSQYHASRFLSGKTAARPGHEGFHPDFDWLLTKGQNGTENAVKVHDGNYHGGG